MSEPWATFSALFLSARASHIKPYPDHDFFHQIEAVLAEAGLLPPRGVSTE